MNIDELKFEKLNFNGVKTLATWAQEEGWNTGPHDAEVYFATDPDGFYGFHHNGELIAGGSIVSYNGEFGFMGFFIVKTEYRAHGIGRKLWYHRRDKLRSRLHKNAAIGMDGVVAMQAFYQKGGFEIAFRDVRYEKKGTAFTIDKNISPIEETDVETILKYDKQCFGFSRPQFLKPWLQLPLTKTFKYIENGELKGFAIIRKCNTGYKVCPLFADNLEVAEALYKACLNAVIGELVYIDIPMINEDAKALIKKYEATYIFECARMYLGNPPAINFNKVFGITTFELG
ncbi:GNAT family N-acetyltransferase [Kordia sp. YSTF-M3]|uniref:GNAT family N-acetyltransferase n=1 Tax=Kordia aestuariivivens TaxID=2759037 RepID=A0ABR7Q4G6_9FLAO|nr:GNAT family N-acetyltransferase [Kordia aestuariivivens]MBC8753403.1 GNAT family N-acetyltransferase [Kordia aestuariivivens]